MDGRSTDDLDVTVDREVGPLECALVPPLRKTASGAPADGSHWQARLVPDNEQTLKIVSINHTAGRALIVPTGPDGSRFKVTGQFQVECSLIGPDNKTVLTSFNRTVDVEPGEWAALLHADRVLLVVVRCWR